MGEGPQAGQSTGHAAARSGGSSGGFGAALAGRCPMCGQGRLFTGLLKPADHCTACGVDFAGADQGDGPAAFVILIIGFAIAGAAVAVELIHEPPLWVHAVLWAPLTCVLAIGLQRLIKAAMIAQTLFTAAREGRLVGDRSEP